MERTIEERRAQHVEYMRQYRKKNPDRRAESQRYWRENKEKIIAKRKAKPAAEKYTDHYRTKQRAYARKYYYKNQQKIAAKARANRKRIAEQANVRRLAAQTIKAGRPKPKSCDICGESKLRIAFDHSHQTGEFRGWICNHCNVVLGYVKDDIKHLKKLISYLEKAKNHVSDQLKLPI